MLSAIAVTTVTVTSPVTTQTRPDRRSQSEEVCSVIVDGSDPGGFALVIASEAKQSMVRQAKNGLLRRFPLRSMSYGGQVRSSQ
jgi:hypothetical protein